MFYISIFLLQYCVYFFHCIFHPLLTPFAARKMPYVLPQRARYYEMFCTRGYREATPSPRCGAAQSRVKVCAVMDIVSQTLSFFAVALVWGITNPLLKKGSVGVENIKQQGRLRQLLSELVFLALRWQYVVPFLINQSGSVLYYITIGQADISLAVPITNSLTFLVTSIAGRMMGEKAPTNTTFIGVVLVLVGVAFCIVSKLP